ncbi:hypothetical protein D3C85_1446810 [compost metagenome]
MTPCPNARRVMTTLRARLAGGNGTESIAATPIATSNNKPEILCATLVVSSSTSATMRSTITSNSRARSVMRL